MARNLLEGTWSLVSCVAKTSNGETSYPWGQDSQGFLSYSSDGFVFVSHMNKMAFESYVGRYTVMDDYVIHDIALCSTPHFIGTKQKRSFQINDDELSLTTEPVTVDGVTHTAFLIWRRSNINEAGKNNVA